jgi:hypothetical protein
MPIFENKNNNHENKNFPGEQKIEFENKEVIPIPEKKETVAFEAELIREQLDREAELMKLTDDLKKEAENKIKMIGGSGEKEKIEYLLKMAREKGLLFAIKMAKDMNDPYILDTFHDLLAREGFYGKFQK